MVTDGDGLKREFVALAKRATSLREDAQSFNKLIQSERATMPALGDEPVQGLEAIAKRYARDPGSVSKADVRPAIAEEWDKMWHARGCPGDPIAKSRILTELLETPVRGWAASRLDPSLPPRPVWGDLLSGTAATPAIAKSLTTLQEQEAAALKGLRAVAKELQARDPRLSPEGALGEAARDPVGKKFYAVYRSAQDEMRKIEGQR